MALSYMTVDSPSRLELLALLQDARKHPRDISCRLVLADWLEEYGDEADGARAELIRIQCQLEPDLSLAGRMGGPSLFGGRIAHPSSAKQVGLQRRQDELLARYEKTWLGSLYDLAVGWEFRRGMICLEVDAQTLQMHRVRHLAGSETWAWVEGIKLQGATSRQLSRLLECSLLASITSLTFARDVKRSDVRTLLKTRWFGDLCELNLAQTHISERALSLLADSVSSPTLDHLCLCHSHLTRRGAERLACSGMLDELTTLDLRHNRLGDAIVHALVSGRRLSRVTHLLLAGNGIGPRGVRALARSSTLSQLTWLDLARNPLTDEGAVTLANAPPLAGLTHLDLGRCQITPEGAEALIASPYLSRLHHLHLDGNEITQLSFLREVSLPGSLQRLDLSGNPLGEAGLKDLAETLPGQLHTLSLGDCGVTGDALQVLSRSDCLACLAELNLSGNALGRAGVQALARCPVLALLEALDLSSCDLDDADLQALATSQPGNLTSLHLADNRIGPEGVRALARSTSLEGLVALDLGGNTLDDESAVELLESPTLKRLSMLSLWDCDITDAGVAAMARSPGLARISRLALAGPDLGPEGARALLDSPYAGSLRVLLLKAAILDPRLRQDLKQRFSQCVLYWPFD